tara:strand:- start:1998 stop:5858 length:3861 start_codon:yes stop_codon:yes gene_type:complete
MARLSTFLRTEDNAVGSGLVVYANLAAFPTTGPTTGDQAFNSDNNKIYVWNGNGWFSVATVNQSPTWITEPNSDYGLNLGEGAVSITVEATDPDGFDLVYSYSTTGLGGAATIAQSGTGNRTYTITPQSAGEFTVAFTASDGVNVLSKSSSFVIIFTIAKSASTTSLVKAQGAAAATAEKSVYFDGTGDYITASLTDTAGTGEFTAEAFFYATALSTTGATGAIMAQRATGVTTNNFAQWIVYTQNTGNLGWYNGVSGQRVVETGAGGIEIDRWYHVAITRNSSNVMTMWLDGVAVGTRASQTQNWNYPPFTVGANGDGSAPFQGYISNVRWIVGTALYTQTFTPPTSPLTAVTNTKLLICQGTTNSDASSEYETLSVAGDASVNNFSPFLPYTNRFYAKDSSTSNHNMVVKGATTRMGSFSPYRTAGYSFYFDGVDDEIAIPDSNDFNVASGNGDFTIECWIYKTNASEGTWFSQRSSGTLEHRIQLDYDNYNYTVGSVGIHYDSDLYAFDGGIRQNEWMHIAWVRTGTTLKWFTNGVEKDSRTEPVTMANISATFDIGAWSGSGRKYKGYIKDFRIVNGTAVYTSNFTPPDQTLTAVANTKLLLSGPGYSDNSGQLHRMAARTSTSADHPYMRPFSPFDKNPYTTSRGGSIYFPGTNDELQTQDAGVQEVTLGDSDFTLEFWAYKMTSTGNSWEVFISQNYGSTGGFRVYKNTGSGQIRFYYGSSSFGSTAGVFGRQGWFHCAIVRYSGTCKIYIDGEEEFSASLSYDFTGGTDGEIEIGQGDVGNDYPVDAYMTDIRIVTGTAVYTGNFTPPSERLTATGGTYPSTTNVNTSIPVGHTRLLLNMTDAGIVDHNQGENYILTGGPRPADDFVKFSGDKSIFFDGTASQYISWPAKEEDKFPADDSKGHGHFTIEGYHYLLSRVGAKPTLYSNSNAYSSNNGSLTLYAGHDGATTTQYQVQYNGSGFPVLSGGTIAYNQWVHYALQRAHGVLRLYIDGTQIDEQYSATAAITGANDTIYIGADGQYLTTSYLNGYLSNVRITKDLARYPYEATPVTLTPTNSGMKKVDDTTPTATASNTILLACHTNTPTAEGSSGGYSLTNNNSVAETTTDMPPGAPAGMTGMQFTASSNMYLENNNSEIPALSTGDWTIEYWVKHDTVTADQTHIAISNYAPAILYDHSATHFSIYIGGAHHHIDGIVVEANKWYHLAWVHNDTTGKIGVFVNGTFAQEWTESVNITSQQYRIGRDGSPGAKYMNGTISNLRIVKGQALYTNSFTPRASKLQG